MCKVTKVMQKQLQENFPQMQMSQLEIWIKMNTQSMIASLGTALQQAVVKMNAQAAHGTQMLQAFKMQKRQQNEFILNTIKDGRFPA